MERRDASRRNAELVLSRRDKSATKLPIEKHGFRQRTDGNRAPISLPLSPSRSLHVMFIEDLASANFSLSRELY